MAGFAGADPAELRDLAAVFDSRAAALRLIEAQLTGRVQSSPWHGPDVNRFIADWNTSHRKVLVSAAALIDTVAEQLRANAEQQERASAADTGLTAAGVAAAPLRTYVQSHPLKLSDDPTEAAEQWAAMSPAMRQAYIAYAPEVVGNTDGLPAEDRSKANLIVLDESKREFTERLGEDRQALDEYLDRLKSPFSRLPRLGEVFNFEVGGFITLEQAAHLRHLHEAVAYDEKIVGNANAVTDKLGRAADLGTQGYLLIYRPEDFRGDGRAAIAFGNPDHAANTAIVVPGLNSTVQSVYSDNPDADNLYRQMTLTNPGQSTSVIAYMGYDAPEMSPSVLTETRAMAGGVQLRDDVAGFQAAHDGRPGHLTVVGHSYGSTTVSDAVAQGLRADDYVLIGSPGMGHASPADFGGSDHLYTGSASKDPVADASWFGTDPAFKGSDATRFHAESVNRGNEPFNLVEDHSRYFDADTTGGGFRPSESLANIATIANGQELSPQDIAAPKYVDLRGNLVDPEARHRPEWGSDEGKD